MADPAQLDEQARVPELLAEAFGAKEGARIFAEGSACIQAVQSELAVRREDLSNPA